jgi:hypothetical protein
VPPKANHIPFCVYRVNIYSQKNKGAASIIDLSHDNRHHRRHPLRHHRLRHLRLQLKETRHEEITTVDAPPKNKKRGTFRFALLFLGRSFWRLLGFAYESESNKRAVVRPGRKRGR